MTGSLIFLKFIDIVDRQWRSIGEAINPGPAKSVAISSRNESETVALPVRGTHPGDVMIHLSVDNKMYIYKQ